MMLGSKDTKRIDKMENTREIVLEGLLAVEKELSFSNKLVSDILDKYDYLDSRDKAFIKRVFEGTIERKIELDYHIDNLASVPVRKMKPLMRCLVRMSAYQILYMDNVPDSAAINEAVKLAKKRKFANLSGFVNGVLRNLSRNKEQLPWPDKKKVPVKYLSVRYSVPEWIAVKWMDIYGFEETESLLASLLEIHPVSIRFRKNMPETERSELVSKMKEMGVELQVDSRLPYIYKATHLESIRELPGFEEGAFVIQDISSCLAIESACIKEGDFVIDACASPGGKSLLASEMAGASGRVISRDVSEAKLERIDENTERMQADNITSQVWDATEFDAEYEEKADVLILDVPCSGLGILGKKRDIKYNATPEGLDELVKLQRQIVDASWKYIKKGGKMIYSTCTINQDENAGQIKWICEHLPFEIVTEPCQLLPHQDNCDGFFYTVLKRKSD